MIIGHDFAWGHLGKTGGDATSALFRLFPRLIMKADGTETQAKHATFRTRKAEVTGKRLLLNLRRLDAWTVSYAQHMARRGLYPAYKPMPMLSAHEMANSTFADDALSRFLDSGRFNVDRWLRTEYLCWDFLAFVTEITEVTPHERDQVLSIVKINAADYDHDIGKWFTAEQRDQLYSNNPVWARIEREVYRDAALPLIANALNEMHRTLVVCRSEATDRERELAELRLASAEHRELLTRLGGEVIDHANGLDKVLQRWDGIRETRMAVNAVVPIGAVMAVISKGDEDLVRFNGRTARHFPQDSDGSYAGHYPAGSQEAIKHLHAHQLAGVTYLVIPKTACWWLEHYSGFAEHLRRYHCKIWGDNLCSIYALKAAIPDLVSRAVHNESV
jgi:hypothetical protein